jgi:hypothetical protein
MTVSWFVLAVGLFCLAPQAQEIPLIGVHSFTASSIVAWP